MESGARVNSAVLCENVVVGSNAVISSGCVIGSEVIIPPNLTILENTHVVAHKVRFFVGFWIDFDIIFTG